MAEILMVTSDLRIEVDDRGETPLLCIYSEGMRADGETGVVVWPDEIRHLVTALCTAAGLLAEAAASTARGDTRAHDLAAGDVVLVTTG